MQGEAVGTILRNKINCCSQCTVCSGTFTTKVVECDSYGNDGVLYQ
jgi:hypothetical protein